MGLPRNLLVATLVLCPAIVACSSTSKYGHAPDYAPLDDEAAATRGATDYDPVMALRMPEQWGSTPVRLFGVVKRGTPGPGPDTTLMLSVRTLAPRNLCDNETPESCRVTVSDREFDTIRAVVRMPAEQLTGDEGLGSGSLVRLVGKLEPDPERPNHPLMRATWHRHWPSGFYVTEASRSSMRR